MSIWRRLFGPPDVEFLKQIGDVPELIKLLHDREERVRIAAATALQALASGKAAKPLANAFRTENPTVAAAAASALASIPVHGLRWLITLLRDAPASPNDAMDRGRREMLATLISNPGVVDLTGHSDALAASIDALNAKRQSIRDALVEVGAPAVEPLIAIVQEGGPSRADAASILGRIGDSRAVESLRGALDDPSEHVRKAARTALGQIQADATIDPHH